MTVKKLVIGPNMERSLRERDERQRRRIEALKGFLKAGRLPVNELLRNDKDYSREIRLKILLRSLPGIGKVRADWILETMRVKPEVELGELSMLRREELIMLLARHFPTVPLTAMTPMQNRERIRAEVGRGRMPRVAP